MAPPVDPPLITIGYSPVPLYIHQKRHCQVLELMLVNEYLYRKLERHASAFIEISLFYATEN